MSSAREIAPSLEEEQEDEGEGEDVDKDEIHPGRKLSLSFLYFSSSSPPSLEHIVPVVEVGSSSLTLSRDGSCFLLSERIRVALCASRRDAEYFPFCRSVYDARRRGGSGGE